MTEAIVFVAIIKVYAFPSDYKKTCWALTVFWWNLTAMQWNKKFENNFLIMVSDTTWKQLLPAIYFEVFPRIGVRNVLRDVQLFRDVTKSTIVQIYSVSS